MIKISTYPTFKPVTVDEVKRYIRITDTSQDTLIGELIDRATIMLYRETSIAFATTTFEITGSDFTDRTIDIYPYSSIESVKYYDQNNTLQTLGSSNYRVFDGVYPWKIVFDTEPTVYNRPDAVKITAVCGYAEGQCPEDYKHVLLNLLSTWFEIRQGIIIGASVSEIPRTLEFAIQTITKRIEV